MDRQLEPSTSASLLGRLRQNPADQESWRLFVLRYGPVIYRWGHHRLASDHDAEDLMQEVLSRMFRRLQTFVYDPNQSFRGFLRQVTVNACCDAARDRQRMVQGSGDSTVLHVLNQIEAREDLLNQLDAETEKERFEMACQRVQLRVTASRWKAFQMLAVAGLSGKEVASRLDMPVATVYGARAQIQQMLKEEIEKLEREEGDR